MEWNDCYQHRHIFAKEIFVTKDRQFLKWGILLGIDKNILYLSELKANWCYRKAQDPTYFANMRKLQSIFCSGRIIHLIDVKKDLVSEVDIWLT